ncbi:MAG: hypothetical protein WEG36_12360 [Gemmatimonadota bacterium]
MVTHEAQIAHELRARQLDLAESSMGLDLVEQARREARGRRGAPLQESLRLSAYHEAGHAIVAVVTGGVVHGAAIYGTGGGSCWIRAGDTDRDPAYLAGAVSESFAGGFGARPSGPDLALIRGGRAVAPSRFIAEDLVSRHWREIERLASALLAAGFVDGETIHAIAGRQPQGGDA